MDNYTKTDLAFYAEKLTILAATKFLERSEDWNEDKKTEELCQKLSFDPDLVWLIKRVLFGPAVVFVQTGKII